MPQGRTAEATQNLMADIREVLEGEGKGSTGAGGVTAEHGIPPLEEDMSPRINELQRP